MLDWYFDQSKDTVWLCTSPNTRAEEFYRKSGWTEVGKHRESEIKFEITAEQWVKQNTTGNKKLTPLKRSFIKTDKRNFQKLHQNP